MRNNAVTVRKLPATVIRHGYDGGPFRRRACCCSPLICCCCTGCPWLVSACWCWCCTLGFLDGCPLAFCRRLFPAPCTLCTIAAVPLPSADSVCCYALHFCVALLAAALTFMTKLAAVDAGLGGCNCICVSAAILETLLLHLVAVACCVCALLRFQ